MNFTFKNYIKKLILNSIKDICIIFLFCLFGYLFIEKNIVIIIFFIVSIVRSVIYILYNTYKINNLENRNKIENDLSNSIFILDKIYFTDKYIFNIETLSKIYYEDILILVPSFGMPLKKHTGMYLYITLYLKNGMKEKFTLDGDQDNDFLKFGEIVLEKNPNVFVGTLKEYEKEHQIT